MFSFLDSFACVLVSTLDTQFPSFTGNCVRTWSWRSSPATTVPSWLHGRYSLLGYYRELSHLEPISPLSYFNTCGGNTHSLRVSKTSHVDCQTSPRMPGSQTPPGTSDTRTRRSSIGLRETKRVALRGLSDVGALSLHACAFRPTRFAPYA